MVMKNLLAILTLTCSLHTFAQNDYWFPNNGGHWEMKTSYGYPNSIWNDYSVTLEDTTWLYNDTLWYSCDYGLIHIDSGCVYFKALWGPPGGLTVYISPPGPSDTITQLLYDFNLNIGDTAYVNSENFTLTVIDIDTTNFLGIPRKTIHIGFGNNEWDTWVAGLGSVHGFFYPWAHTFEASCDLCFFTGFYSDTVGTQYSLSFDNPSTCETLELNLNPPEPEVKTRCGLRKIWITLKKPEKMEIYSSDGKLVYRHLLPVGESVFEFDFLERGAYIIKIGSNYSEKFIKT